MKRVRTRLGISDEERGAALVMVIILGVVMMMFVATASTIAVSGLNKSSSDLNWNAAMAAAYAGVDDYQSRLSNDPSYVQYGNKLASFSSTSPVKMPTGSLTNPAFSLGSGTAWASVAGSDGKASYRYEVDSSSYALSGVLRLRATGRVGDATRSIVVNLKQQGFIDFLYFTDYEIEDPKYSGDSASTCTKYAWEGRPENCSHIAFDGDDTTAGPVHSNDAIRVCKAKFTGEVTTAYNPSTGKRFVAKTSNGSSCTGANFTLAGNPKYSPVIGMPPTNSEMKKEVRYDIPAEVPRPGCLYTGPTRIVFNSDGTMTVRSPLTKATQINGATPPVAKTPAPAECGTPGTGPNQLGSATGQKINVLDRNLMYVQNVPADDKDPNYSTETAVPKACKGSRGRDDFTNGIGYPLNGEVYENGTVADAYGCRAGDVFVEGDFRGQMSISAENFVYITGNIKYGDPKLHVLGLVGNNAVWVWNPVNGYGTSLLSTASKNNRQIDAAILSVAHTFQVHNKASGGDRGTLTVNGALAQKFRGIVKSNGNGYKKNYVYDTRFRYLAPPKFLSPVTTTYGVSELVEVSAAFEADGTLP